MTDHDVIATVASGYKAITRPVLVSSKPRTLTVAAIGQTGAAENVLHDVFDPSKGYAFRRQQRARLPVRPARR